MPVLNHCRLCGGPDFRTVIDLGRQYLTGIFPLPEDRADLSAEPLHLVRCVAANGCGLVQLADSCDPSEMYGANYGYRSGLNPSMVRHLESRIRRIKETVALADSDMVIDIGSNDGTTLGFYAANLNRVGIDPTAGKFRGFYPPGCKVIEDFFSAEAFRASFPNQHAKVVTAFSMMYDLENPIKFAKEVSSILDPEGVFVFEQSYLPLMLERVAFDTICHEHLEYYGLRQIDWLLEAAGLEAIDVELNDVNGGSFAVTAGKIGRFPISQSVQDVRRSEAPLWNQDASAFEQFQTATREAIDALRAFIRKNRALGKRVACLGASTKGNVLLQAAGLDSSDIEVIGEVNPDKYGCVTPGSWIPIVPEDTALEANYDFYIVLPWHFREFFLSESKFENCNLVFPLPSLTVRSAN